jgi:hypothetical protein
VNSFNSSHNPMITQSCTHLSTHLLVSCWQRCDLPCASCSPAAAHLTRSRSEILSPSLSCFLLFLLLIFSCDFLSLNFLFTSPYFQNFAAHVQFLGPLSPLPALKVGELVFFSFFVCVFLCFIFIIIYLLICLFVY